MIVDRGRVLLVKRGHAPLEGEWSLPGGSVELGEALEAALIREVREETGLGVEVGPVVDVVDRVQRAGDGRVEYHYVIIDYVCRVRSGQAAFGSDAAEVCWADTGSLADYRLTTSAAAVIKKALASSLASRRSTPGRRGGR